MIYVYQYRGRTKEIEYPMGEAPQRVGRYVRVYTAPTLKQLSPLDRGDKPAISHQLPTWYGFGQRETVWREHMQRHDIEDTPHRRRQMIQAGIVPNPKYIEKRSREAALKAGAGKHFTRDGKPLACTKRETGYHLDTAKKKGDSISWD